MKAVRFEKFGGPEVLELVDVPDPSCAADEVVVQVGAAAINRLDLDERSGTSGFELHAAHQLGREGAGIVVDVGRDVDRSWLGRSVALSAYRGCWQCDHCQAGQLNVCRNQTRLGIDVPGTYAELVATTLDGLFELPEAVDVADAACLQLGLGTAWHGLIARGELRVGESVLVTGAGGGVGSAAVQIGALAGANVIAAASTGQRRQRAMALGASHALDSAVQVDEVRELTDGGVDVVFDATGGDFLETGLATLKTGGRYVLYGSHAAPRGEIDIISFFRSYARLIATRGWRMADMRHVIVEVAHGRLDPQVTTQWPLGQAVEAHRAFEANRIDGKAVLIP